LFKHVSAKRVVVDLPFVPVIAIMGVSIKRPASSISPITGTSCLARALQAGKCVWYTGAQNNEVLFFRPGAIMSAQLHITGSRLILSTASSRSDAGRLSVTVTRASRSRRKRTAPPRFSQVRKQPHVCFLNPFTSQTRYLSFNVESEINARRIAIIQNRMITFDSAHPLSSK
jgi:hypothetical protein